MGNPLPEEIVAIEPRGGDSRRFCHRLEIDLALFFWA